MYYTVLLRDGDSKKFKAIQESNVYATSVNIKKEEYVNHVGKRKGTAFRKLVESEKNEVLP